jgi:surface antigen
MKNGIAIATAGFTGCVGAIMLVVLMFTTSVLAPIGAALACSDGSLTSTAPDTTGTITVSTGTGNYTAPEHSDNQVAEAIASYVESIAADDSHGYSQANRRGNPDYDCSSLVNDAVRAAGIDPDPGSYFVTQTMGPILEKAGFTHLTWGMTASDLGTLQRGDIIVLASHHTETYLGGGYWGGARNDQGHPEAGDQDGNEIVAGSEWPTPLGPDVYRWTGGAPAATGTPSLPAGSDVSASVAASLSSCTASNSAVNLDDLCGGTGVNIPDYAQPWVEEASKQSGMRKALVAAMMKQESSFRPEVCNSGGYCGLLQIGPSQWLSVHGTADGRTDGPTTATYGGMLLGRTLQQVQSIKQKSTVQWVRDLSDEDAVVIAWNAGPGYLSNPEYMPASEDGLPTETRNYLASMHQLAGTEDQCSAAAAGSTGEDGKAPGTSNGDIGNKYAEGQCTWYAYERRKEMGIGTPSYLGNGGNWWQTAPKYGLRVDHTPQVGAAISFLPGQAGADGVYGHVGVVESVNPDGTIGISESNWLGVRYKRHDRTLSDPGQYWYVH